MRRRASGLIALLALALLLAACDSLPPGEYALIPLDGQDIERERFEYDGSAGRYGISVWEWVETPQMATPSPVPTHTPYPTLTPWPTYTPYPTYTPPGALPTATPESGITATPPSGGNKVCLAASSAALNLRSDHSTSAAILDNVDPAMRMEVLTIWVVSDVTNEWLNVRTLTRSGVVRTGWVFRGATVTVGIDETEELCWEVPISGPGTVPTPAPTATPGPPVTPVPTDPPAGSCVYVHPTANMNIRATGSTGAAVVGVLPANTRVIVGHIYPDTAANRWAFISYTPPSGELITGWVAVNAGGVAFGSLQGDCAAVPRYQVQAPMIGWTVVPGASRDALIRAGDVLKNAGLRPSATITSDGETATRLHDEGWFVVVRLWTIFPGDCPDMSLPPATSAGLRVEYLAERHGGARFDAAQLSNECTWPSAAYLRDWLLAAVGECDARGWTCIPTVFNTGAPELDWLPVLRPALRLMREHNHYLGYNAYPYDAERMLCEQSDDTSYTTFRWRRFTDYVPANELPPLYLTEAARGDGARSPALEDAACFAAAVSGQVAAINYWYCCVPLAPWQAAAWTYAQLVAGAEAIVRALL